MPKKPRQHRPPRQPRRREDDRPSPARRGYGAQWRRIREQVLTEAGIPRSDWSLYAVDHRPPYNPDIEPDHRQYTLVPMRKEAHNRKTAAHDQKNKRDDKGRWVGGSTS